MTTGESTTIAASITPLSPSSTTIPHSPWHSPIPYLFGGLAAILGLIAIALLLLACSYRQLFRRDENGGREDVEKGENTSGGEVPSVSEDKVLVIMAGELTPTFLATPKDFPVLKGEKSETREEEEEEFAKRNVETGAADDDYM